MEQSYNLGVDNKHIHPGSFQVNHLRLYPHNVEFMPPEDLETEGQSSAGNPTKEEKNKFANILGAVKSFSIAEGIAIGFFAFVGMKSLAGEFRELTPGVWVISTFGLIWLILSIT